ncbi:hypothetical protein GCM10023206_11940 [Acinetobacter puyangensis]
MAEYLLSPLAEQDMEDIFDYTVEQWGFDQAMIYFDHSISKIGRYIISNWSCRT